MAAAKKKVPAKKQKTPAKKGVSKQTTSKKVVKAKSEVKIKKNITKTKVKVKSEVKVKKKITRARVEIKAKTKKTVDRPSKKMTVPQKKTTTQKPEKKALTGKTSVARKKDPAAVSPSVDRIRGLKGMLVAKRDTLLKEARQEIQKYVSGENRQLVDTAIDEADWAAVEISEDINLKRLSAQRQLLIDVEECLRKVNEGTYGICEDCGEEISKKRLRVIPTATLCIDCKEQREKMAILDQEIDL